MNIQASWEDAPVPLARSASIGEMATAKMISSAISTDSSPRSRYTRNVFASPAHTKWYCKLHEMERLARGWNGYSAPAPLPPAIYTAAGFLQLLVSSKLEPTRIAPSVEGGAGLTIKKGKKRAYVEFFNDGQVFCLFSDDETMPNSRQIPAEYKAFDNLITEIKAFLNA